MKTRAAIFLLMMLSILSGIARSESLADAAKPLTEGAPEVAITRLRALLGQNLSADEWRSAAEKLAEALIAAGQPNEALQLLDDPRLRDDATAKFLRAQALAGLQRWSEALPLYELMAGDANSPRRLEATFGAAEMFRALGQWDDAVQRLNAVRTDKSWKTRAQLRLTEIYLEKKDAEAARRTLEQIQPATVTERKTRRFLSGRLEMITGHPEKAVLIFESLLKRLEGATHAVMIATLFQAADAHLQLKTPETGDDLLEDFIEHHPQDVDLAAIFAKLDELYRAEHKPARSDLERWTREPEQPRRAFAQWYLARIELRGGHRDRALRLLRDLRANHPATEKMAPPLLELARLTLEDRQVDDALSILNEARALQPSRELLDRIDLATAEAQYRAEQWGPAAAGFERVAYSKSDFAKVSIFNAALSRLKSGDGARFAANYDQFTKANGEVESRAELRLAEGLAQAARGEEPAAASLRDFVRDFPNDSHASEAWVALAELAFHRVPPALEEARKYLEKSAGSKPTPEAIERAGYLSIWLEDARGGNDAKVIDLANAFLNAHPDSRFATEVRMKLAETYYRRQDFANAQTHFETLAQQNPTGPLAEKALFFAGESAMSSMGQGALERAVTLFDRTVQLKGELRWAARNQEALIERKLGKLQDALLVYDDVLKNDAKPSEKREALCGKGDIYFDLSGSDPKNFDRAIEAYDALAKDAHDPGHWRNQGLFKKGMCLEKKADRAGALSIFYDVLETPTRPDKTPEYFWFYKAGFNAARLLEDDSKWASAAAIYEKLVSAAGPRSDEAKARLNRLRLEHFLWQN